MDQVLHQEKKALENLEKQETDRNVTLDHRIGRATPVAEKASGGSTTEANDSQQFKSELQDDLQYDDAAKAEAHIFERTNDNDRAPYHAAEDVIAGSEISGDHLLYARRYSSEAAARETVGNNAVDLDKEAERIGGFKGNNYPSYDISSESEVSSVKTHWDGKDGTVSDSAISAYKNDFSHMMGWGREFGALEQDAQNIIVARDAGVPVPDELARASQVEATEYLRDNSRLRIPDDHVSEVRSAIEQDIRQLPSNYYLPENPSQEQIDHVLRRVQGIGVTSGELQDIIQRRTGIRP